MAAEESVSPNPIVIRLSGYAQTNDKLAMREIGRQLVLQTGHVHLSIPDEEDEEDGENDEVPGGEDREPEDEDQDENKEDTGRRFGVGNLNSLLVGSIIFHLGVLLTSLDSSHLLPNCLPS